MSSPYRDSIVPPMDARDILRVQRRTAFLELMKMTCYLFQHEELVSDVDEMLDRFFKSGIELERRQRENG